MTRNELRQLAADRIADAKALLSLKCWAGAYYLAGYAVECGLKVCIAKLMKSEEFPDKTFAEKCWTHDLERLVVLAGLSARDTSAAADAELSDNWITVKDWSEASRYLRSTKAQAVELYAAITNQKHGVIPWIRLHW